MKIKLTDTILEHANLTTDKINFGMRAAGFNGDKKKQTMGIAAELVIYKVLGMPFPSYDEFKFGDIEINGKQIDIKTRRSSNSYMRPGWSHNLVGHQLDHLVEYLLFINYNAGQNVMEVDGWLTKKDILKNLDKWFKSEGESSVRDDGTYLKMKTNNIEIPTEAVNKINSIEDIKKIGV